MKLSDAANEAFAGGPRPLEGIRVLAAEHGLGRDELGGLRADGVT